MACPGSELKPPSRGILCLARFGYCLPGFQTGGFQMAYYWLTPPSRAVFIISVFLAVLALLVRYAHVAIPVVSNYTFETLLVAFLLLLAGNLFRDF
jgi:hypothetical protein